MNSFDAYSDEITKQVSMSVDASLQNIDRLAISIIYSDVIQQALTTDYPISFINPFYRLWQEDWLDEFAESEELTRVLGPYAHCG